jgi:hypothetical protein
MDDRCILKERVKSYLMAPMPPLNNPSIFSILTYMVYGLGHAHLYRIYREIGREYLTCVICVGRKISRSQPFGVHLYELYLYRPLAYRRVLSILARLCVCRSAAARAGPGWLTMGCPGNPVYTDMAGYSSVSRARLDNSDWQLQNSIYSPPQSNNHLGFILFTTAVKQPSRISHGGTCDYGMIRGISSKRI